MITFLDTVVWSQTDLYNVEVFLWTSLLTTVQEQTVLIYFTLQMIVYCLSPTPTALFGLHAFMAHVILIRMNNYTEIVYIIKNTSLNTTVQGLETSYWIQVINCTFLYHLSQTWMSLSFFPLSLFFSWYQPDKSEYSGVLRTVLNVHGASLVALFFKERKFDFSIGLPRKLIQVFCNIYRTENYVNYEIFLSPQYIT